MSFSKRTRTLAVVATTGAVVATLSGIGTGSATAAGRSGANDYTVTNLVSDQAGAAMTTDSSLVNAWGLAQGPTTPVWVSDNETGVATIYKDASTSGVTKVPLTVAIPGAAVTGQVFNRSSRFRIGTGSNRAPALFIFASESGHITAWNQNSGTTATSVVHEKNAIFKGLAIARSPRARLFAANFHSGQVEVFNGRFQRLHPAGAFSDPSLPARYAPFNIRIIHHKVFVAYAKQDAAAEDDVSGAGHGFLDVYTKQGHLIRRLISRGELNSPWGLTLAPAGFGKFSHDLLVGNFGNGWINAYRPRTGAFVGSLATGGRPIAIDGLWALKFGNGTSTAPTSLMFSAGPNDESHGLFGIITAG